MNDVYTRLEGVHISHATAISLFLENGLLSEGLNLDVGRNPAHELKTVAYFSGFCPAIF